MWIRTVRLRLELKNEARPPEKLAERVEQTTEDLHIQKLRNRNIFELSGGESRKSPLLLFMP